MIVYRQWRHLEMARCHCQPPAVTCNSWRAAAARGISASWLALSTQCSQNSADYIAEIIDIPNFRPWMHSAATLAICADSVRGVFFSSLRPPPALRACIPPLLLRRPGPAALSPPGLGVSTSVVRCLVPLPKGLDIEVQTVANRMV